MAIMKFPHISRYITAEKYYAINFSLRFLVVLILFMIFFVNMIQTDKDKLIAAHALNQPNNPSSYKLLAAAFVQNNDFASATYFNELGLSLFPFNPNLLRTREEIYYKMNEPEFMAAEISAWKKIIKRYPDYRDGYARLVFLDLKIGKREEAKKYLEVVKKINPNWLPLEQINF
jgi:tetratricopeptide (TPR) repeat protein